VYHLVQVLTRTKEQFFLADIPAIVPGVTFPLNESELYTVCLHFWDSQTSKEILTIYYPLSDYKNVDDQASAILRDYIFACPTRRALSASSDNGYPSWMYHFVYANDWIDYKAAGDYHGFELMFVWDNQWPRGIHNFTASDQQMANIFGYYWGNMAKYNSPNAPQGDEYYNWPSYDTSSKVNLLLDTELSSESYLFSGKCDFWDQIFDQETSQ